MVDTVLLSVLVREEIPGATYIAALHLLRIAFLLELGLRNQFLR